MKRIVERACGGLVLALSPLIAVGVFAGWLWAFVALLLFYLWTLAKLWMLCMPNGKRRAKDL